MMSRQKSVVNCLTVAVETMPKLSIPSYMKYYSQEYIEENENGCGSVWTASIVPDSILGMSIKLACMVHDLEYQYIINLYNSYLFDDKIHIAEAKSLKKQADARFRQNIQTLADYEFLVEKKGTWSLFFWISEIKQAEKHRKTRYFVADHLYYEAVKDFGWTAIESKLKNKR